MRRQGHHLVRALPRVEGPAADRWRRVPILFGCARRRPREGCVMDGIHVAFEGRLGGDPETRFLPNGSEVLQFSIVPTDSRAADGAPEWVRVSIFAEKLSEDVVEK